MSYLIFDAPLHILIGGEEDLPAQLPHAFCRTVQMAGITPQCFTVRGDANGMDMALSGGSVYLSDHIAHRQLPQYFLIALWLRLNIQDKLSPAGYCRGVNLRMIPANDPLLLQLLYPGFHRNPGLPNRLSDL